MATMTPGEARAYWNALLENAVRLVLDADLLLSDGLFGLAGSLTVLAQEELGKALWLDATFQNDWSSGADAPRVVDELLNGSLGHVRRYESVSMFDQELAMFWGDFDSGLWLPRAGETENEMLERRQRESEEAAIAAIRAKNAGFYVQRDEAGRIKSPSEINEGSIPEELQTVAQVAEMMLIKEQCRQKFAADPSCDAVGRLHSRLLPIAHPEDWIATTELSDRWLDDTVHCSADSKYWFCDGRSRSASVPENWLTWVRNELLYQGSRVVGAVKALLAWIAVRREGRKLHDSTDDK